VARLADVLAQVLPHRLKRDAAGSTESFWSSHPRPEQRRDGVWTIETED
jgi:hypothetical protein